MARRTLAVSLACLFTLGGVPAEGRAATRNGCSATARHAVPGERSARSAAHAAFRMAEPRAPGPREAGRMLADLRQRLSAPDGHRRAPDVPAQITVPVWVHVIRDGRLSVPDDAVPRQIQALNSAYAGRFGGVDTGIRFTLKGVTHSSNREWFRDPLGFEDPMKRKLRVGGPETLNLYLAQLSELTLGYATYPFWYKDEPAMDGVVVDWRSVPDGPLRDFNRGYTAVHEIGHWLGLLHPFERGCQAPGDYVDDTPAEASPTTGCPQRKDTCTAPGEDPVHNYMDYSHDRCMTQFTAGQATRMREMWSTYRAPKEPLV